jgi:hypothetical protein
MASRRSKQDGEAHTISIRRPGPLSRRGRVINIPAGAKVKIQASSLPGLLSLSFHLRGRKLHEQVLTKNSLVSFAACLVDAAVESSDFLDELLRYRAEAGDFSPLIEQLRKDLPPTRAQLVADIIEKRLRRPRHRTEKPQTYIRPARIALFVQELVDKDIPLVDAKAKARQTFQVSKLTVTRAVKKFENFRLRR